LASLQLGRGIVVICQVQMLHNAGWSLWLAGSMASIKCDPCL